MGGDGGGNVCVCVCVGGVILQHWGCGIVTIIKEGNTQDTTIVCVFLWCCFISAVVFCLLQQYRD